MKHSPIKTTAQLAQKISWKWWWIGAGVALILAAVTRLPFFPAIPSGLNRDEAALGYNAYSLLKTGKDEYGISWPISITSFGDQKLPGYVYLLIPFIATLGLNPVTIRLPSLIAGFLLLLGAGVAVLQITRAIQFSYKHSMLASFLTMLMVALSPWAMHFSRVAYEANVALACFVWGYVLYHYAIEQVEIKKERVALIAAATLWSATLLTYHSYHIFLPLLLLGLLIIDVQRLKKLDRKGLVISVAVGLVAVLVLWRGGILQADLIKDRGISPFNTQQLWNAVTVYRASLPPRLAFAGKLFFNPLTEGLTVFAQNLATVFSGTFFFIHGSGHGDNNPGNMSNFPLYILPLTVAWLLGLWKSRRDPAAKRFLLWVGAAIIPASLTIQPQHEVRLEQLFLALEIGAGVGAVFIWEQLRGRWMKWVVAALFIVCVATSAVRMSVNYFLIIPNLAVGNERYPLLASALAKYKTQGVQVVTQSPENSPYIWYLEQNTIDPAWFQTHVQRYTPSDEGFIHVKQIDNLYFEKIDWNDIQQRSAGQPVIVVVRPEEMPGDQRASAHANLLEELKDHKRTVLYQVWMIDANKNFKHELQPSS